MNALKNKRGVGTIELSDSDSSKPKTYIKIAAPVHGPISCDDALEWAAWLIYFAAPHSKLKVAALLKQIQGEKPGKS